MLRCDVSVATPGDSGPNTLVTLADNIDQFLKQMTCVINHRQSLYYEKEKCLKSVSLLTYFVATKQQAFTTRRALMELISRHRQQSLLYNVIR